MDAVVDVVEKEAFLTALAVSVLGALVVLALVRASGHARDRALPVGGFLVAAGSAAGLAVAEAFAGGAGWLVAASVLLTLATAARGRAHPVVVAVVLVAGAGCVARAAAVVDDRGWVAALVIVGTVLGALGADGVDRAHARFGLGPLLFAATTLGVFACVPDTEQAIPVFAASLGLLVALWPPASLRLGAAGASVGIGLALWAAAVGGTGRAGSVVGAVGCLGVFVLAPAVDALLAAVGGRRVTAPDPSSPADAVLLAVTHGAVVLFCARVAGFQSSAVTAAVLVALAFSVAGGVLSAARVRR